MSTVETESAVLTRTFDAALEPGDGRTVIGRCVPYNTPATVSDGYEPYTEMFLPGSVSNASGRMDAYLDVDHEPGFRGVVGHNVSVDDKPDGLYGTFRLLKHGDGEKARELVEEGFLRSLSVQFRPITSRRVDNVVQRVRVHVQRVALCAKGAYPDAQVLAIRSDEVIQPETWTLPPFNPSLAARAARQGVDVPVELALEVGFVNREWNPLPSWWPDANTYARACLIDDNPAGQPKTKALAHIPIREPGGKINISAVQWAEDRDIDQARTSQANKERAHRVCRRLLDEYRAAL